MLKLAVLTPASCIMKSALSVLTVAVLATLPVAANDSASSDSRRTSARSSCSQCSHDPCRCGYSPSYYTHYRKPVHRVTRTFAPIGSHWSRPVSGSTTPSPLPPRAVPAPKPTQRLAFEPTGWVLRGSDHSHGPDCDHGPRPGRDYLSATVLSGGMPTPTTLVPTPRPPRVVPAVTPGERMAFPASMTFAPTGWFLRGSLFSPGGHRPGPACESDGPFRGDVYGDFDRDRKRPGDRSHKGVSQVTPTPTTLVPSPRRARTAPAVTPKQSLGFNPNRNWSRSISRRGFGTSKRR